MHGGGEKQSSVRRSASQLVMRIVGISNFDVETDIVTVWKSEQIAMTASLCYY